MNRLLLSGLMLGWITLSGCARAEKAQVEQQVQGLGQQMQGAAARAQQEAANAKLEASVKNVLLNWKGLDARAIDVEANNGAVTLRGEVTSPEQAKLAERVARQVAGAKSVTSQLTRRIPATTPNAPATGARPKAPGNSPAGGGQ